MAIYRQRAWETLATFQTQILRAPTASTVFLLAANRYFQSNPGDCREAGAVVDRG